MTTPTPPPGYREPTKEELACLPSGAIVFDYDHKEWDPSSRCSYPAQLGCFYAVPIHPATGDESICPDCKAKMTWVGTPTGSSDYYHCFACESHTGDAKPVEQRQELLPCPFCGPKVTVHSLNIGCDTPGMEDCGYWDTGCDGCGVAFHSDSQEESEAKWNTRK